MIESIPVFYTAKMLADAKSFSPSAAKPRAVLESWCALGVPLAVEEPARVSEKQLCLAHDEDFVRGILSGAEPNGFGNTSPAVARSLLYTSGAMLAAARAAIANGDVAVASCAGFHHAGLDSARGYCTFNGLMVAAQALTAAGEIRRIGILDFDNHYGDGTDEIIQRLKLRHVVHYTAGQHWFRREQAAQRRVDQDQGLRVALSVSDPLIKASRGAEPPEQRQAAPCCQWRYCARRVRPTPHTCGEGLPVPQDPLGNTRARASICPRLRQMWIARTSRFSSLSLPSSIRRKMTMRLQTISSIIGASSFVLAPVKRQCHYRSAPRESSIIARVVCRGGGPPVCRVRDAKDYVVAFPRGRGPAAEDRTIVAVLVPRSLVA